MGDTERILSAIHGMKSDVVTQVEGLGTKVEALDHTMGKMQVQLTEVALKSERRGERAHEAQGVANRVEEKFNEQVVKCERRFSGLPGKILGSTKTVILLIVAVVGMMRHSLISARQTRR